MDWVKEEHGTDISFTNIPIDALNSVFKFCDIKALLSLSSCCHKLNNAIKENYIWLGRSRSAIATNLQSHLMRTRSAQLLSNYEKCKISRHWVNGICAHHILVNHRLKYLPWLELEKRYLWYSKGNVIFKCERYGKSGLVKRHPRCTFKL